MKAVLLTGAANVPITIIKRKNKIKISCLRFFENGTERGYN